METIVDTIIIISLLFGAVYGFKRGFIKSAVSFIGTLAIIVIAFQLKNPVSEWMYLNLPFFNFSGSLAGITVYNVLIYEAIAYLLVFAVLEFLLKILVLASGIIEKLLKFTVIFGIFSKILGLIFGVIEAYILLFIGCFILQNISLTSEYIQNSELATKIISDTPYLKGYVEEEMNAVNEIYSIATQKTDNETKNEEAFEVLLKYDILTPEAAEKLASKDKIDFSTNFDVDTLITKYKEVTNHD